MRGCALNWRLPVNGIQWASSASASRRVMGGWTCRTHAPRATSSSSARTGRGETAMSSRGTLPLEDIIRGAVWVAVAVLEAAHDREAVGGRRDMGLRVGLGHRTVRVHGRVRRREQAADHPDDAGALEHAAGDEQDLVGRVAVAFLAFESDSCPSRSARATDRRPARRGDPRRGGHWTRRRSPRRRRNRRTRARRSRRAVRSSCRRPRCLPARSSRSCAWVERDRRPRRAESAAAVQVQVRESRWSSSSTEPVAVSAAARMDRPERRPRQSWEPRSRRARAPECVRIS